MPAASEPFDPFGTAPSERAEAERRLREAENVLASYHHATDLLAEALQNATDAIDARSDTEPEAPRRLRIDFDAAAKSFSVTDTGTGLSESDLKIIFRPNISFKVGTLARGRAGRSRGEKGVGLSFLLLACDRLTIQTCMGKHRYDAVIEGAASWARGAGEIPPPKGLLQRSNPDTELDSDAYTKISLHEIHIDSFDRDLFQMPPAELVWILRTRTAVGNTAPLFAEKGHKGPADVKVTLGYRDPDGTQRDDVCVPFLYATPEELLREAEGGTHVYTFEELSRLKRAELRRRTRQGAMRYLTSKPTGDHVAYLYLFAMDGNTMNAQLELLRDRTGWAPTDDWQGFTVATRNMPTGVPLSMGRSVSPRGYERRLFALIQYDVITLDVGRKSLPGGTVKFLNAMLREAWEKVSVTVKRMAPAPRNVKAGQLAFNRQLRAALGLPDLGADVPYLKVPDRDIGVSSLFHELIGSRFPQLAHLRPLTAGVFRDADAFIYPHKPNGADPLHVLFGVTPSDIVDEVENNEINAMTAGLAVVWTLTSPEGESAEGVEIAETSQDEDGATHLMLFDGLAGREEPLRTIVLEHLLFPGK
jgi:hypothetical protein